MHPDELNESEDADAQVLRGLVAAIRRAVDSRWQAIPVQLFAVEPYEVVGALLARQGTLAIELLKSPGVWNAHVAPLFLRAMVDALISLRWILADFPARALKFYLYGLGQEKLQIEHLKKGLAEQPGKAVEEGIKARSAWLNSQRRDYFTEVDVGSWSDKSTRDMAHECGCEDLYNYAYSPFSAATHNMWTHLGRFNVDICDNPLHKYHRVPAMPDLEEDFDYVFRAVKYFSQSLSAVDDHFQLKDQEETPFEWLNKKLTEGSNRDTPAGVSDSGEH